MDIATLIGLVGGFAIVAMAILTGGSFLLFVNVPSILIVIIGSVFVVMMKFNIAMVGEAIKIAMKAFMFKIDKPEDLIEKSFELSNAVRKNGVLALENIVVENEFMSKGVNMLVDGIDGKVVKEILNKEKDLTEERHKSGQKFFTSLGDVAPAMGMIGTLIGLVQMLSNMSDPDSIGPAMAVALLTTLYGAIIANMVAIPIADKLALRSEEESQVQALIVDAIANIEAGIHPNIMRDALQNYLPKSKRKAQEEEKAA